jgi:hypothetical protein
MIPTLVFAALMQAVMNLPPSPRSIAVALDLWLLATAGISTEAYFQGRRDENIVLMDIYRMGQRAQ